MTAAELAAAADLDDGLTDLADLLEAQLERSGWRGISPARAARHARCTTADARRVLAHLVGCQRAEMRGSWRHLYATQP